MGCSASTDSKVQDEGTATAKKNAITLDWYRFKDMASLATIDNLESRYKILKPLGFGASCSVSKVKRIGADGDALYALKMLEKPTSENDNDNEYLFANEIKVLALLEHENILKLVESFQDANHYYIVTMLYQGGELFDRVADGSFSELDASRLTRDMLGALSSCHTRGVVHRDLKPENFVFETKSNTSSMKLIDFGCALAVRDDEVVTDVAGSPYYVAPEVINEGYVRTGAVWKAADMWSVGVIVFLLVTGYPPFNGDSQALIFRRIKQGQYRIPSQSNLSASVQELIKMLLVMEPSKRLTAEQAMKHPWVAGETATDTPLDARVIESLANFRTKCLLKKAVGRALVANMTDKDKAQLEMAFKKFDVDQSGALGADEIGKMMKYLGKGDVNVNEYMEAVDADGDGQVDMTEFAQASAIGDLSVNEKQIKASFDMFDKDGDGFVTHQEIEAVCNFLSPDAVQELISEADADGDNKITFEEWLNAMREIDVKKAGDVQEAMTNAAKQEAAKKA